MDWVPSETLISDMGFGHAKDPFRGIPGEVSETTDIAKPLMSYPRAAISHGDGLGLAPDFAWNVVELRGVLT